MPVRALALALVSLLAAPAVAQAPRGPRVHVEHVRGPIHVAELRRAWSSRRFARCEGELHSDHAHLHVRVDPDASVHVERERPGEPLPPELACVVDVLRGARFHPQTETTLAYVTVFFRTEGVPHEGRDTQ